MIDLFYAGDPLYMGLLTLVLFINMVVATMCFVAIKKGELTIDEIRIKLKTIKSIGLFGLILGIFTQLMGLHGMFLAIEEIGEVSPALLAGGLKVSLIATEYGLVIF
ncbi:MAG: MotA/TolQ/ExbB proton channel family protein [Fulvivirga sp.]